MDPRRFGLLREQKGGDDGPADDEDQEAWDVFDEEEDDAAIQVFNQVMELRDARQDDAEFERLSGLGGGGGGGPSPREETAAEKEERERREVVADLLSDLSGDATRSMMNAFVEVMAQEGYYVRAAVNIAEARIDAAAASLAAALNEDGGDGGGGGSEDADGGGEEKKEEEGGGLSIVRSKYTQLSHSLEGFGAPLGRARSVAEMIVEEEEER